MINSIDFNTRGGSVLSYDGYEYIIARKKDLEKKVSLTYWK